MDGIYLCLKSDVPIGGHIPIDTFGESVVVSRAQDEISVDDNICTHRGHRVCRKTGEGPIHCPYHGKRFEPQFQRRVVEFGDMLFLAPLLPGLIHQATPIVRDLGDEFFRYMQIVDCPFFMWIENTMDPLHLKEIHKDGFYKMFDSLKPFDVTFSSDKRVSSYRMPVKESVWSRYEKIVGYPLDHSFLHVCAFPNLSMTSFLGVFHSIESVIPDSANGCMVISRFFQSQKNKVPKLVLEPTINANRKILQEDKEICESWAQTYHHLPKNEWLPGEERIRVYEELIQEHLTRDT